MNLTAIQIHFLIEAARYWQRDMDMEGFESPLSSEQVDEVCALLEDNKPISDGEERWCK